MNHYKRMTKNNLDYDNLEYGWRNKLIKTNPLDLNIYTMYAISNN